jgi:hypothetical protein
VKYYRNSITVEWLSNEPWGDEAEDLDTVNYEMIDGGSIGTVIRTVTNEELTREQAIDLDIIYGGDGTFIVAGEDSDEPREPGTRTLE